MRSTPFFPVLVLTALLAAMPARADTPAPSVPLSHLAQLTMSGEGRIEAAPDMATVSLGVVSEAATAAAALAGNSDEVARVLANLRAAGLEARDIQTTGLSLGPVWTQVDREAAPRITGYSARNGVTVRVRDLDALGGILDAAVKDGANTLDGLAFGMQEPGPLMDEARRRAVADARRRAEIVAEAAGLRLGRVLSVSEGGGGGGPVPQFRMDAAMVAEAVPVAGGEVGLAARVTMVWEILP